MKKKVLLLVLSIIMVSSLFSVFSKVNATTNGVKWQNLPVTVYATNQLNGNEISYLQSAISEWNSIGKGTLIQYGGIKSTINSPRVDGISCVGKAGMYNADLARANITLVGDIIKEVDIVLNTNTNVLDLNLKSIFMHELGHALGLDDNMDSIASIMYRDYTGNTNISQYDINDINSLY